MAAGEERAASRLERVFGIDPRALAAVRIGLGVVLLVDLSSRANLFRASYTDAGVVPRSLLDPWLRETIAPFHLLSGGFAWEALLFGLALAFALLLALGLHTRIAAVVSWLLVLSLQVRNPFVLNFGDQILRVSMFWAVFLPLGRHWSLDATRSGRPSSLRPVCSVASAAFLLQVCFVYFFTAILKSGADWHEEGTALYYALQLDWLVRPTGLWLREHLWLTKLLTWSTLVLEYVGPFLLLAPLWWLRLGAALGFMALHVGISASLRLGVFPWIDVTVLLAFVPKEVWDAAERWARRALGAPARPGAGPVAAPSPAPRPLARALAVGLAGVLAYVLAHNVASVWPSVQLPGATERALRALGLQQKWLMFTPNTPRDDGWFVMPGRLADGRLVDVSPHGPELVWSKPERISADFPSARWAHYMGQNSFPDANGAVRRAHVRWLCREWNRSHPPAERLERVDVWFVHEGSPPPGLAPRLEPRYLASHECPRAGARVNPGWDVAVPESGPRPPPLVPAPPVAQLRARG